MSSHHSRRPARFLMLLIAAMTLLVLAGCGTTADVPDDGKLKVAVTFDALKEFTQAVGGDKVDVYTLIPDGTEPHEFQPTTKTIKRLGQSQLFVYNGLGMEPWASKVVDAAKTRPFTRSMPLKALRRSNSPMKKRPTITATMTRTFGSA